MTKIKKLETKYTKLQNKKLIKAYVKYVITVQSG